jgi:hypothetical protein
LSKVYRKERDKYEKELCEFPDGAASVAAERLAVAEICEQLAERKAA